MMYIYHLFLHSLISPFTATPKKVGVKAKPKKASPKATPKAKATAKASPKSTPKAKKA
jgi:hypothetical protein